MKHNVGAIDRMVRAGIGAGFVGAAVVTAMPLLAVPGAGLMLSALAGSCPGYWLLGRSTCRR